MSTSSESSNQSINQWDTIKLGDVAELLSGGTPSKQEDRYWGGDIPWVSSKDMKELRIGDSEDHITKKGLKNGTKIAKEGSILLEVRGMALSDKIPIAIATRDLAFNQDIKAIQCNGKMLNKYLFYQILGRKREFQSLVDEAAHGTKRIQTDRLKGFELIIPPKKDQEKIVNIISLFDKLIENNKRRIEVLEEMAETIYREWFVNYNFPGSEDVEMKDSNLGMIPENWKILTLGEMAHFQNGYAFSGDHWDDEGRPIIKISELKNGISDQTDFYHGEDIDSKYHLNNGDLIFSWSGSFNVAIWDKGPALLNQHLYKVIPNEEFNLSFVHHTLLQKLDYFRTKSVGTTMQHIRKSDIENTKVAIPSDYLRESFNRIVQPIRDELLKIQKMIEILRQTRDLLLPKLISGKIEI